MPVWDAEVEIDEGLVRVLVTEQFPELDASSPRLLGEGWDNSVWVIEERWAFRFPRRQIAIPGVERELAFSARLAGLLPVPIPVPTFVGQPSDRYAWPFFGAPLLHGRESAEAGLADEDRVEFGRALGRFLQVLHSPSTRSQVDPEEALPVDPNRRAEMPVRVDIARTWLAELESLGWKATGDVDALFAAALELGPSVAEALVHGDLHGRHVLVHRGALSGVIDWGDVCRADPAIDLVLVWSYLPEPGREAFFGEYGPVSDEQALRARTLAVSLCAALAVYGRREGFPTVERECLAGIERALSV
jgi:aminoglycoside phosphotransferase (APT) family kinase protein